MKKYQMHAEFSNIWQNFPTSIHKKQHFLVAYNANVKRTEFTICYSIPVIQYIVFLGLIYEENVCLFPEVRCTLAYM